MKKFSIAAAAMAAVLCFCACGKSSDETVITSATDNVAESPESENVEITDEETATSSEVDEDDGAAKNDGMKIVCTIFPEYDWVKEVLGEKAEDADITMLLDNGVDLHSYQPTAEDIMKISECDLFVYVGGESDEWVDDALAERTNDDMVVINLMDALGDTVKEEEVVEGMQAEEEESEDADENAADSSETEEEVEYDEHVWLSLKNAQVITEKIADALATIDPENADTYKANADDYMGKLASLDSAYESAVSGASVKTVLFGDRFPFRYMTDDYGLDYYAAFVGCSAETEASFETIAFLSGKVDELGLKSVLTIEGQNHKIAETIISNTKDKNQQILTMDSMQSTTSEDVEGGVSYLGTMEQNLEVLKEALE
ncbi:metal ABC transporter substrate-binding protein [Butyrivibrio sp. WCD2001]|uniref:metal ABC transporter substrate-binding protein n=1 Tax=Butyrivibrio sp. WCD2001 TaxID=1280681 RepID=UPI00040F5516|nr:metal ABC transporter substrate-binding protein [Butyrivibrio sp. WCD2001]